MENNNYFKGFIGSLVGAIVFSVPWLLMYVYGGYILSILAFVIGIGSFKFYKMFGGIVTKKTPIIIVISSILIITLLNFVVIPLFLLYKEGMGIDLSYLSSLYSNSEFVSAMLGDYLISVLFTFLGIGGVIKNINYEAYGVIDNREYIDDKSETEQIKELESVYDKFGAYDKRSAIPVSVLTSYIKSKRINSFMEKFYKRGIIVNTGMNKSYFDKEAIVNEEKASSNSKKYKRKSIKVVFITLIIIFFAVLLGFMSSEESGPVNYKEYKYKNYISIVFNIEYYLGGAHPNHNIETIIYNTKDHNFITINNLISDNKNIISNLSKISRRELEKNKIFQDKTLKAMMLDGTTPNKKNFTKLIFSNKGLILYFERYQIAPYYLGEYNITIPYNNLNINI